VKIWEKTNEVVIQPGVKEIVSISKETDEKIIEPVISYDKNQRKKQMK
jgi:hypothetical protein